MVVRAGADIAREQEEVGGVRCGCEEWVMTMTMTHDHDKRFEGEKRWRKRAPAEAWGTPPFQGHGPTEKWSES